MQENRKRGHGRPGALSATAPREGEAGVSALAAQSARKGQPRRLQGMAVGQAGRASALPFTSPTRPWLSCFNSQPRFLVCKGEVIGSPCLRGCSAQEVAEGAGSTP